MTTTRFGERLIEARKAAGMSQAELAGRIGVSDTYISAIETGRKAAPPHAHVKAIAVCLGVDEEALWRVALADRESRLRDRLAGVPTSARASFGTRTRTIPSMATELDEPERFDASGIARRIDELLPTRQDREQFIESLEILIKLLREAD